MLLSTFLDGLLIGFFDIKNCVVKTWFILGSFYGTNDCSRKTKNR